MARAIILAKHGTGCVSPNPRVGAIILDENKSIIGEGWHKSFGGPHAEVEAIRSAGKTNFSGCTLVVTLEPCSHFGKTPPCVDLIIQSNFSKVIIGSLDKNPLVQGNGIKRLETAGIDVISGVFEDECDYLNRSFFHYIQKKIPYVELKVAQSLDGNIALKNGNSKWITCSESRSHVQLLRAESDAILVGTGTLIADNPSLNVRELDFPSPKRIVIDSELKLPLDLNIFSNTNLTPTILFYNKEDITKLKLLEELGVKTEWVRLEGKYPHLRSILETLGEKYKIASLLVEGGSKMYSAFLKEKLVDELHLFIAPKIFGSGLQCFGDINITQIIDNFEFEINHFEKIGLDLYLRLTIKK